MDSEFLREHRNLVKKHYPDYKWSEIKVVSPNFNFEVKEMYKDPDQKEKTSDRLTPRPRETNN